MPKHKETKIVDFTDIQMFDLVADIDSYDLFLPWCNNSGVKVAININNQKNNLPQYSIAFIFSSYILLLNLIILLII